MYGGWVFFIGGMSGIIAVARAKYFSWKNSEFLDCEGDIQKRAPMTFKRRMVLLLVYLLISAYGAWQLQSEHAWNPFAKNQPNQAQHE
jgi:hypothetical protein